MAKVNRTDECWLWTGAKSDKGYGNFYVGKIDGKKTYVGAHRWLWEYVNGPVPDGLVLDHECRVRQCVRPDHLRATTHRENILAGTGFSARKAAQTYCVNNHELSPENVWIEVKTNSRRCRACNNERSRRRYAAKKLTGKVA